MLDQIVQSLPHAIATFDRDHKLCYANVAFLELLKLSDDSVEAGWSFADIVRHSARRGLCGPVSESDAAALWVARLAERDGPHRRTAGPGGLGFSG